MAPKDGDSAITLLARAHSPDSTTRIYTEKIKNRPLLLKPSEPSNGQQQRRIARQRKLSSRRKKQKPAPLSSRERRALCIYDIPSAEQKYSIYEPLHAMWLGYIREVLGSAPVTGTGAAKLCSADFHGAELEVVRSRCVSRVGVRGIVVRDSKFAFVLVTKGDVCKTVPKEHTVFRFVIPLVEKGDEGEKGKDLVFELHGNQFIYRAADRANRKFKAHFFPDL
jgi:ribonuclease P protein subunit POP4